MREAASVLPARRAAASALAVTAASAVFYLANSLSIPPPIRPPGYGPNILYVMLGDPATALCGVWDGVDGNGSPVSGAVTCDGERVPPDDPRFPQARRTRSWI